MLSEVSFSNNTTLQHPISPMEQRKRNLSLEDLPLGSDSVQGSNESISLPPKKRSKHVTVAVAVSDSGSSSVCSSTEDQELERKRVASRDSSRRSRLREKQRLDHFTTAKYKLDQENQRIRQENDELRALIQLLQESRESVKAKQLEQEQRALQAYTGVDQAQLLAVLSGGLLAQQTPQVSTPKTSQTESALKYSSKGDQQIPQVDYNAIMQLFLGAMFHGHHPSK